MCCTFYRIACYNYDFSFVLTKPFLIIVNTNIKRLMWFNIPPSELKLVIDSNFIGFLLGLSTSLGYVSTFWIDPNPFTDTVLYSKIQVALLLVPAFILYVLFSFLLHMCYLMLKCFNWFCFVFGWMWK